MTRNALAELEFDAKTRKRAEWEAFEFSVPAAGSVAVSNASYGDEVDEHTHAVNVEDSVPVGCSCKADEYQPGACKHRVAVAINAVVLEAATVDRTDASDGAALATDGGAVVDANPTVRASRTTTRRVAITRSAKVSMPTLSGRCSRSSAGTSGPRTTRRKR